MNFSPLSELPIMFAFASGDYYIIVEFFDQDGIQLIKMKGYFTMRSIVDKW